MEGKDGSKSGEAREVTERRGLGWRSGRFGGNERRVAVRGGKRKLEVEEANAIRVGVGVAIFEDFKLSVTHGRSGYGKTEKNADVGLISSFYLWIGFRFSTSRLSCDILD